MLVCSSMYVDVTQNKSKTNETKRNQTKLPVNQNWHLKQGKNAQLYTGIIYSWESAGQSNSSSGNAGKRRCCGPFPLDFVILAPHEAFSPCAS